MEGKRMMSGKWKVDGKREDGGNRVQKREDGKQEKGRI
jgi:hypothetical protein